MRHSLARLALLGAVALTGGCMTLPANRAIECAEASGPTITYGTDGVARTQIDVLTYNIEGLPFPARNNRPPYLREIGRRLAALRAEGQAPDIILFQEVFSSSASSAVVATGYPSIVSGPGMRSRQAPNEEGALPGRRRILRGEIRPNFTNSGLVIATRYPVINSGLTPYARGSCAGFDCLSNKGALFAEIAIPGVPGAIDVFTTHMQAQRASGVAPERFNEAHARQARELSAFAETSGSLSYPTIVAGDFNLRNNDTRFYYFTRRVPLENVHRYCIERPNECDVRMTWEHADQWRREQNLHFYLPGEFVRVRPIRAEGFFDGGPSGPVLADHNGFRVIYELSWPTQGAPAPICPARPSV